MSERSGAGLGDLLKDLRDETQDLVRQEAELIRAEVREKVHVVTRQIAILGIGAVVLLAGLIELLAAVNRGLAAWFVQGMDLQVAVWLAPLVVAILFLAVGSYMVARALDSLKNDTRPEHSVHAMQKTTRWAKQRAHRRSA